MDSFDFSNLFSSPDTTGIDPATLDLLGNVGQTASTVDPGQMFANTQGGGVSSLFGTPDLSNVDPATADLLTQLGYGTTGIPGLMNSGANLLGSAAAGTGGTSGGGGGSSSGAKAPTGAGTGGSLTSLLTSLLPMLLAAGGGILNRNAANTATAQTVAGLNNASAQATNLINGSSGTGGAAGNYSPYLQGGQAALSSLAGMGHSNIAGNFKPLGSGKAFK